MKKKLFSFTMALVMMLSVFTVVNAGVTLTEDDTTNPDVITYTASVVSDLTTDWVNMNSVFDIETDTNFEEASKLNTAAGQVFDDAYYGSGESSEEAMTWGSLGGNNNPISYWVRHISDDGTNDYAPLLDKGAKLIWSHKFTLNTLNGDIVKFTETFDVKGDTVTEGSTISFTGDNVQVVFINNKFVGATSGGTLKNLANFDPTAYAEDEDGNIALVAALVGNKIATINDSRGDIANIYPNGGWDIVHEATVAGGVITTGENKLEVYALNASFKYDVRQNLDGHNPAFVMFAMDVVSTEPTGGANGIIAFDKIGAEGVVIDYPNERFSFNVYTELNAEGTDVDATTILNDELGTPIELTTDEYGSAALESDLLTVGDTVYVKEVLKVGQIDKYFATQAFLALTVVEELPETSPVFVNDVYRGSLTIGKKLGEKTYKHIDDTVTSIGVDFAGSENWFEYSTYEGFEGVGITEVRDLIAGNPENGAVVVGTLTLTYLGETAAGSQVQVNYAFAEGLDFKVAADGIYLSFKLAEASVTGIADIDYKNLTHVIPGHMDYQKVFDGDILTLAKQEKVEFVKVGKGKTASSIEVRTPLVPAIDLTSNFIVFFHTSLVGDMLTGNTFPVDINDVQTDENTLFYAKVTGPSYPEGTLVSFSQKTPVTLAGLIPGEYTIVEVNADGTTLTGWVGTIYVDGSTVADEDGIVTVVALTETKVIIENKVDDTLNALGTVAIQKMLLEPAAGGTYSPYDLEKSSDFFANESLGRFNFRIFAQDSASGAWTVPVKDDSGVALELTTDEYGMAAITDDALEVGKTYHLVEVLSDAQKALFVVPGFIEVVAYKMAESPASDPEPLEFANKFLTGSISGTKYRAFGLNTVKDLTFDSNNDGVTDYYLETLAGWTVELYDSTGTTLLDSTTTDVNGNYTFTDLLFGTYTVKEYLPDGTKWTAVGVVSYDVVVGANAVTHTLKNFYNRYTTDLGIASTTTSGFTLGQVDSDHVWRNHFGYITTTKQELSDGLNAIIAQSSEYVPVGKVNLSLAEDNILTVTMTLSDGNYLSTKIPEDNHFGIYKDLLTLQATIGNKLNATDLITAIVVNGSLVYTLDATNFLSDNMLIAIHFNKFTGYSDNATDPLIPAPII